MVKVIGITGSPRFGGNTEIITNHILRSIEEEGIETKLISLAGLDIQPCKDCEVRDFGETCPIDDDLLSVYREMKIADGILLTTPVYFGSMTANMKAFIDRSGAISLRNGRTLEGKIGASFVVGRRTSHYFTQAQLDFWFQVLGFIMPGSIHPNIAFGKQIGDVTNDKEGMKTAWQLGKNITFLLKKLKGV